MKTKTMNAILMLGLIRSFLLVNHVTVAQETLETGHVVATGQINVSTGYSNAAVILRGWQLQKNNSNDMEIMDLGLAITDVEHKSQTGVASWKVRIVNFSDDSPTDDIRFSYDFSVILLTNGIAIDFPLQSGAVDKSGLTVTTEQVALDILGYQSGAIFPTGFMLHANPRPVGSVKDFFHLSSRIQNFRFELADFNYDSMTGIASWKVITDFHDKDGSPKGYKFKYGYTIILTNGGQAFSQSSGIQTSTSTGSVSGMFSTASIPEVLIAPIGWELGYESGDQNTNSIGVSINNVSVSGASVSWIYNATLRDKKPDQFRWNAVAGGLTFNGKRIDGHYDSRGHYRFAVMPDDDRSYEERVGSGTYLPFTANLSSGAVVAGPLSSDRPFRHVHENGCGSDTFCADPPTSGTPNTLQVTSVRVIDNGEGDLGAPFANWYLWAFPAKGFDLEKFQILVSVIDQFNGIFFTFAGHTTSACAVSTILHGPYLSDGNNPEWGEEGSVGEQYLEYFDEQGGSGFPIWDWEWPCDDRVVVFLWESDERISDIIPSAPDDPLALFLIERGSSPGESFSTADVPGSSMPGILTPYGDQHLGSITFLNARSPGDIFVDGASTRPSKGWWWQPFLTITEAMNAVSSNKTTIISVESGSYNETLTMDKPVIVRSHGGPVVIGQ